MLSMNFIVQKCKLDHLPALQTQEPSTGEQRASFLQLHIDEQFIPYVPTGQGIEQSEP